MSDWEKKEESESIFTAIIIILGIAFIIATLIMSEANAAETVKVAQYNERVRIVLTTRPCPMLKGSLLAVAQRIDKQFMRGCYTYEPAAKLIRIQWSQDVKDFSVLDADRFKPDVIPDGTPVKGQF